MLKTGKITGIPEQGTRKKMETETISPTQNRKYQIKPTSRIPFLVLPHQPWITNIHRRRGGTKIRTFSLTLCSEGRIPENIDLEWIHEENN